VAEDRNKLYGTQRPSQGPGNMRRSYRRANVGRDSGRGWLFLRGRRDRIGERRQLSVVEDALGVDLHPKRTAQRLSPLLYQPKPVHREATLFLEPCDLAALK
jgi:hypothetical protein